MIKKLLLFFLSLAFLLEIFLTAIAFINPERALALFKVGLTADTSFLAFITAWFLLLISALCALAIYLVAKNKPGCSALIYILAIWWIGIGIGIYFFSGRPDNLLSDSLKGLILVVLNYSYGKQQGTNGN